MYDSWGRTMVLASDVREQMPIPYTNLYPRIPNLYIVCFLYVWGTRYLGAPIAAPITPPLYVPQNIFFVQEPLFT